MHTMLRPIVTLVKREGTKKTPQKERFRCIEGKLGLAAFCLGVGLRQHGIAERAQLGDEGQGRRIGIDGRRGTKVEKADIEGFGQGNNLMKLEVLLPSLNAAHRGRGAVDVRAELSLGPPPRCPDDAHPLPKKALHTIHAPCPLFYSEPLHAMQSDYFI